MNRKQLAYTQVSSLQSLVTELKVLSMNDEPLTPKIAEVLRTLRAHGPLSSVERNVFFREGLPRLVLEAIFDLGEANCQPHLWAAFLQCLPDAAPYIQQVLNPFLAKGLIPLLESHYAQFPSQNLLTVFLGVQRCFPGDAAGVRMGSALAIAECKYRIVTDPFSFINEGSVKPVPFFKKLAQLDPETHETVAHFLVRQLGAPFFSWGCQPQNQSFMMQILYQDQSRDLFRDLGAKFIDLLLEVPKWVEFLFPIVHPSTRVTFGASLIDHHGALMLQQAAQFQDWSRFGTFLNTPMSQDGEKVAVLFSDFCRDALLELAAVFPGQWNLFVHIDNDQTGVTVAQYFLNCHFDFLFSRSIASQNPQLVTDLLMATTRQTGTQAVWDLCNEEPMVQRFFEWGQVFPADFLGMLRCRHPQTKSLFQANLLEDWGDYVIPWGSNPQNVAAFTDLLLWRNERGICGLELLLRNETNVERILNWGVSNLDTFSRLLELTLSDQKTVAMHLAKMCGEGLYLWRDAQLDRQPVVAAITSHPDAKTHLDQVLELAASHPLDLSGD